MNSEYYGRPWAEIAKSRILDNVGYYGVASQRLDATKLGIPSVISNNSGKSKSLF